MIRYHRTIISYKQCSFYGNCISNRIKNFFGSYFLILYWIFHYLSWNIIATKNFSWFTFILHLIFWRFSFLYYFYYTWNKLENINDPREQGICYLTYEKFSFVILIFYTLWKEPIWRLGFVVCLFVASYQLSKSKNFYF